jgi:protein O-GlcNAc transferase
MKLRSQRGVSGDVNGGARGGINASPTNGTSNRSQAFSSVQQLLAKGREHHQAGRLAEAEAIYRQILTVDPNDAGALHLLGVMANQVGQPAASVELIARAVQIDASVAAYHGDLGIAYQTLGRLDEAVECYARALALRPDHVSALNNQGVALQSLGQPAAALASFERSLKLQPNSVETLTNVGITLRTLGRLDEAEVRLRRALKLRPQSPETLNALASVLLDRGQPEQAQEPARQAVGLDPAKAHLHDTLGAILRALGQFDEAVASHERALALAPGVAATWLNLAGALQDAARPGEAVRAYQQAITLVPDDAQALAVLGTLLQKLGRLDEAIEAFERAAALRPDDPGLYEHLGVALHLRSRMPEAILAMRRSLALAPDQPVLHSNLIFVLDLIDANGEESGRERQRWNARFGQRWHTEPIEHRNAAEPERRLRMGYVSADFYQHSVAHAILPILRSHDRAQIEVVCYSGVTAPDETTAEARSLADAWRDVGNQSDDQLVEQIVADGIDILVDLSGHSNGNRLTVFGRKPAPVQVTAWGYATGTGLDAIDALLTDAVMVPAEEHARFAEEVIDLPSALCFDPPRDVPPVGSLPAADAGIVTFGSFHRIARLTPEALDLWAQTVAGVPGARMLLKSPGLDEPATRARIEAAFARHGMGSERLTILGETTRAQHLATYGQIDVHLDTIPQSGGVTTMEALMMGVPSVTLRGQTIAGRTTASFMTTLGLGELIGETPATYVAAAAGLAGDLGRLAQLRATLRDRLLASPIGDRARYTRAVEDAYRALWRRWCATGERTVRAGTSA